jgi:CHASE3 domain sensor protein
MLTLKQLRDVFFSLLNNSAANSKLATTQLNVHQLFEKCAVLSFDDQELHKKVDDVVAGLRRSLAEAGDATQALKSDSEKRFADFFSRI